VIYRILCNAGIILPQQPEQPLVILPNGRLMGAFIAGVEGFALKAPDITNPRARFYFTEAGWHQVGRIVAANARREGRVVKVIRRKNPHPSQIVYEDELQVAIIPLKRKTKL
jgi:hypothetical protein